MARLFAFFRATGIFFASALTTLAMFGLLLALAWSLVRDNAEEYKLISSLAVSAIALIAGGWLAGKLARGRAWQAGSIFGLAFGLCSFSYLTGDWRTFIAAPLAAFFGGLGGWISNRW